MTRRNPSLLLIGLALSVAVVQAYASNSLESTNNFHLIGNAPQASLPHYLRYQPNQFESIEPGESVVIPLDLPEGAVPLEMVLLPAGQFSMGSPEDEPGRRDNESPLHEVTISQPLFMGQFVVTQAQYEALMGVNPAQNYGVGSNYPVYSVSWFDAARFCNRLSQLTGRQPVYDEITWTANMNANGFRLPTEAEWEYACRAGTTTRYYWGDDLEFNQIGDYAWYSDNSGAQTHEVGLKHPNAWGLYDLSGNVWEWCQDWLGAYPADPQVDPLGPASGATRMMRGGSWGNLAGDLRSAQRSRSAPISVVNNIGFRVALPRFETVEPPPPTPTPTPEPPSIPTLLEQADLNNDGFIDAQDLLRFNSHWAGSSESQQASDTIDFNRDGAVDVQDLFLFMSVWHKPVTPSEILEPGETITILLELPDGVAPLEMVSVPAGEFTMGSPEEEPGRRDNEGPQHRVTLSQPFYLGKYQVTQAQYEAVMGVNPANTHGVGPNHSVYFVTWYDAALFCNRLSEQMELQPVYDEETWAANSNANGFRLPTEAEWEYACRAGTRTRYYWGDEVDGDYAWYIDNSDFRVQEVGLRQPNPLGLFDMNGNVWEWCQDWLGAYQEGQQIDPLGPATGSSRVFRGGSWGSSEAFLRSALRSGFSPEHSGNDLGFRIVLPQPPE